jgi:hypothetical protein
MERNKISLLEKAGVVDPQKVYEGLHLSRGFLERHKVNPSELDPVHRREIDTHLNICERCSRDHDSILPFADSENTKK